MDDEQMITNKVDDSKNKYSLIGLLMGLSFIYHMIPRFLVYRWIHAEEISIFLTVDNLVKYGKVIQEGFYPVMQQQIIYFVNQITGFDHVFLCQIFNPLIIALTIIPIYFFTKEHVSNNQTLSVCLLWSCSEALFYRSAHFGTTEILSIFFMVFVFYLYVKKYYVPMIGLIVLMPYAHLLPFVYTVAVLGIHRFLTGTKTEKILATGFCVSALGFIYSPFFTHNRISALLNPVTLISKFKLSNIFIYNFTDLLGGLKLFSGIIILMGYSIHYFKKNSVESDSFSLLLFTMTLVTCGLVGYSWIAYSPHLFAPPRLLAYFVLPLSIYFVKTVSTEKLGKITFLVCLLMIISGLSSMNRMLYLDTALTEDEWKAVEDLEEMGIITDLSKWWTDYTVNTALSSKIDRNMIWNVTANFTKINLRTKIRSNFYSTSMNKNNGVDDNGTNIVYPYHFVFLSERMKSNAFFIEQSDQRSIHIRTPIIDVWGDNPDWILIYEKHGVLVYKRK